MAQQTLPTGFRFSPTDEELVMHYLRNKACGKDYPSGVIAEVDIYKHEPWDLPEQSNWPSPDPVWYFFNSQEKRHSHSSRISRTTGKGYWKATGKDRKICNGPHTIGIKKTLIYYTGRAPSGKRTDWVMHEYKLDEDYEKTSKAICSPALCRIRKKGGPGPRNGEQFGAPVNTENSEYVEDVDDAVDEKVSLPLPQPSEFTTTPFHRLDSLKPEEQVFVGLDDILPVGSLENSIDFDTLAQFENPEATSLEDVAIDTTQRDHINSNHDIWQGLCMPWDQEHEAEIVNDYQSFPGEENILRDLLELAESHEAASSGQDPLLKDFSLWDHFRDATDGFIEMYDMDSPLHDFVPSSPNDFGVKQQQLPAGLFDKDAMFGCPAGGLLNAQGLATRRVRLQIIPQSSASETSLVSSRPMEEIPSEVPGSSGVTIQPDNTVCNGSQLGESSMASDSDTTDISGISLPTGHSSKESQFVKTFHILKKMAVKPVASDSVIFSPSLASKAGCLIEVSEFDDKGGLSAIADATLHDSDPQAGDFDCEAGPSSRAVLGSLSKLVYTTANDGDKDVSELTKKMKTISLGSRLVELESNLSTTFNDRVFALGKPVAHFFPANDYVNPYNRVKGGLMRTFRLLGLAVFMLCFIFLGIHVLSKFVSSLAA